ncbi:hypothetical protein P9112_000572 [Eukaryota sp. TZLM1-RC]
MSSEQERQQNRNEKKCRKALSKLNLRPVSEMSRVVMKHGKDYLLVFENCDVFKYPDSDTYVIFGAPQVQDLNAQRRLQTAEQYKKPEAAPEEEDKEKKPVEETGPEEEVDVGDLDPADVQTVMDQTQKSKAECVAALKEHNGDLVDAIMALSS